MFIYKITCLKNNKIYIGQTTKTIEERFAQHKNAAIKNLLNTHLCNAMKKYGVDNFIIEQIDTANTQEELTEKEYYWINYYETTNPKIGYNETNDKNKCGGNTYGNPTTITAGGEWTYTGYGQKNNTYLQLKDGEAYYLQTPVVGGSITSVTVNYTAVSSDSRTVYFNTSA